MEWTLLRDPSTSKCTISTFRIGETAICYALEDVEREVKIPKQTAIPRGRYQVKRTLSQRFGHETLQLLDVPNFTGIRIHAGNTDKDTEGCILPGFFKFTDRIGESRNAVAELDKWYDAAVEKGENVWLTVDGVEPEPWSVKGPGE